MKRVTGLSILGLIALNLSAQVRHNYYMIGVDETCLIPIQKTLQEDSTYVLQFADSSLQNYFANTNVYEYKQPFATANNAFLKKVWRVTLDNDMALGDLLLLNGVENVESIGSGKAKMLAAHTPNDYITFNGSPLGHLELIKARDAWGITTGDPNVLIGIVDHKVEHVELDAQVVLRVGPGGFNSSSWDKSCWLYCCIN